MAAMQDDVCVWHLATTGQTLSYWTRSGITLSYRTRYCLTQSIRRDLALLNLSDRTVPYRWLQIVQDRRMYCMAVGRDKPPGLYLALPILYTYLCKVDLSMALHYFSLFADVSVATPWHGSCSGPGQCAVCTANSGCSLGKVLSCQSSFGRH